MSRFLFVASVIINQNQAEMCKKEKVIRKTGNEHFFFKSSKKKQKRVL